MLITRNSKKNASNLEILFYLFPRMGNFFFSKKMLLDATCCRERGYEFV